MRNAGRGWLVLLWLLLPTLLPAQTPSVRAQLSSGMIALDESVTLSITARDADGDIDTSELEEVFDVVSRSQSQQVRIINGERSDITTWALELLPRSAGIFTVPAVQVGSAQSQLLSLTVAEAPTGSDRKVFVETGISKSSPWVQEQTLLTLRVFQSVDVLDGSLEEPRGDGLMIVPLGDRQVYTTTRDGVDFRVTELRFAVFAQRSGPATIEPVTLLASIPADRGRAASYLAPVRRLTRRSEPLLLDVRSRPADAVGQWWLPASEVELGESWSGLVTGGGGGATIAGTGTGSASGRAAGTATGSAAGNGAASGQQDDPPADTAATLRVGEPATRTITLHGIGVLDTQLPRLELPQVDGLRIYEDGVDLDRQAVEQGVSSRQVTTWSVVPERSGSVTLPAIRVHWFDTESGTTRLARLPARTFRVLPALAGDGRADDPAATAGAAGQDGGAGRIAAGEPEAAPDTSMAAGPSPFAPDADHAGEAVTDAPGAGALSGVAGTARSGWQHWALAVPLTLALGLSTLVLLWQAQRRRADAIPGAALRYPDAATRRRLAASCRSGEVEQMAAAVMAWARSVWPLDAPRSLSGVAERLAAEAATVGTDCQRLLSAIDAARYSPRAAAAADTEVLETLPGQLDQAWRELRSAGLTANRNGRHLPQL